MPSTTTTPIRILLVLWLAASALAQSDPTVVTLHVARTSNYIQGVLVNLYVEVNDRGVGSLANGESSTFVVPVSRDGVYRIQAEDWTGLGDDARWVRARPGESIRVRIGCGFDGIFVDPPSVEPLHPLRIFVSTGERREIRIGSATFAIERDGFVELPFRVPTSRIARLEATVAERTRPIFTSPLHAAWLVCDPDGEGGDEAFLAQLELARAHHFGGGETRLRVALDAYRQDFAGMIPGTASPATRELIAVERAWIDAMWKATEEGVLRDALVNAGTAVAEAAVTAILTRGAPTRGDAVVAAIEIAGNTAWDAWTRENSIAELETRLRRARTRAWETAAAPAERPAVMADWDLQRRLLGTWWCREAPRSGPEFGYRFGLGGRLEQLDAQREIDAVASWIVADGSVRIRWSGGSEEIGTCRWTGDGLRYEIVDHDDSVQVGDIVAFGRRGD